jgi:hypothetical protein
MLILPSFLEKFESLKDRTVKLTFGTNELSPQQLGEIGQALQREGFLAFKDNPFKQEEKDILKGLDAEFEENPKTPSQRLRAVLYVSWKQKPEGYEVFSQYYEFKMEKIIGHLKSKLDD